MDLGNEPRSIGKEPRLLDLKTVVGELGGPQRVARVLMVTSASVYRWIAEGSLPKDRVTAIAEAWELPRWLLHDPWAGTPWAMKHMSAEETRDFMEYGAPETATVKRGAKLAKGEKPKPPPMIRADGQPQPGWRFTYRPKKVDQYNSVVTVKVARGAEWVESFPEGNTGWPVRFTWLDGREIGLADNGSGTLVYVEVDTGHPFGDSKTKVAAVHKAIRAMATRGVHDRVEAKWEGDESDMEGVDGED